MTSTRTNTIIDTHTNTPDDLITQEEAAVMFNRTKGTIRDWRRNGKIETHRRPDGMVYVSIDDCNRHIAQITTIASRKERNPSKLIHNPVDGVGPTPGDSTQVQHPSQHPSTNTLDQISKLYERFIANLQEQVETEKREKESVRIELRNAHETISEKDERIRALEKELYGTPAALLVDENPMTEEQKTRERGSVSFSPLKVRDRALGVYDHFNKMFGRDE